MTIAAADLQGTSLFLIGMMGAGKSTVGQRLARYLGYLFFDTDQVITQAAGCSIPQIFAESGEAEFRRLETQTLGQLAAHRRLVVATGGGIVLAPMNWSYLQHGLVIWLDAPSEVLWQRLQGDTTRPLLRQPNPQQTLLDLLHHRQPLYAQADLRVPILPQDDAEAVTQRILTGIPPILKPDRRPASP